MFEPENLNDMQFNNTSDVVAMRDGLKWAINTEQVELIKALKRAGVDVTAFNHAALKLALKNKNHEIVELLLPKVGFSKRNATNLINEAVNGNFKALIAELLPKLTVQKLRAVSVYASEIGATEYFKTFEIAAKVLTTATLTQCLYQALMYHHAEMFEDLYTQKKDLLDTDTSERLLQTAIQQKNWPVVKLFFKHSIDFKTLSNRLPSHNSRALSIGDVRVFLEKPTPTATVFLALLEDLGSNNLAFEVLDTFSAEELEFFKIPEIMQNFHIQAEHYRTDTIHASTFQRLIEHGMLKPAEVSDEVSCEITESMPLKFLKSFFRENGRLPSTFNATNTHRNWEHYDSLFAKKLKFTEWLQHICLSTNLTSREAMKVYDDMPTKRMYDAKEINATEALRLVEHSRQHTSRSASVRKI